MGSKYNFNVAIDYCGIYNIHWSGIEAERCFLVNMNRNGIVLCNTGSGVTEAGIKLTAVSHGNVNKCGLSDNDDQGIYVTSGGYASIANCFGDNNGAWGVFARSGGQASVSGIECSGGTGNHTDAGTADTAGADQAAAW